MSPLARTWQVLAGWGVRQWATVVVVCLGVVLLVGIPTDLIDTPVFGREIPPTAWAWPSLLATAVLTGLLVATYVDAAPMPREDTARRGGWIGGFLTFFAVGCPVCNKLVLIALGSAGAMRWFAPVQPFLQVLALVLLVAALWVRLSGAIECRIPQTTQMKGQPSA